MGDKKYFIKDLANYSTVDNITYISNKYTGEWFKMPTECFDLLMNSFENKLYVEDIIDCFADEEDKKYYLKILDNLDKLDLLHELYLDTVRPTNMRKVVFSITNRCNLTCAYCCVDSKIGCQDLPLDKIKTMIDKITKLKPLKVVISGGEPMLRDDFFEILAYIRSVYDGRIQLCTNATYINKHNIDTLLQYIYGIDISLDGYDQKSCESVRGKGVFEKVLENIRLLKARNFKNISVSMVVGEHNSAEIAQFRDFCKQKGVMDVVRSFSRFGRGERDKQYLRNEQDIAYFTKTSLQERPRANTCGAGITQIFINYNGMVYPCPLLQEEQYKICHMDEMDDNFINKILKQSLAVYENMNNIKTINDEKCKDCGFRLFCTTCLGERNKMLKSNDIFAHNCQHMKEIFQSIDWNSL